MSTLIDRKFSSPSIKGRYASETAFREIGGSMRRPVVAIASLGLLAGCGGGAGNLSPLGVTQKLEAASIPCLSPETQPWNEYGFKATMVVCRDSGLYTVVVESGGDGREFAISSCRERQGAGADGTSPAAVGGNLYLESGNSLVTLDEAADALGLEAVDVLSLC